MAQSHGALCVFQLGAGSGLFHVDLAHRGVCTSWMGWMDRAGRKLPATSMLGIPPTHSLLPCACVWTAAVSRPLRLEGSFSASRCGVYCLLGLDVRIRIEKWRNGCMGRGRSRKRRKQQPRRKRHTETFTRFEKSCAEELHPGGWTSFASIKRTWSAKRLGVIGMLCPLLCVPTSQPF